MTKDKIFKLSLYDYWSHNRLERERFKSELKEAYTILHKVDLEMLLKKEKDRLKKVGLPIQCEEAFKGNMANIKEGLTEKVSSLKKRVFALKGNRPYGQDIQIIERKFNTIYNNIKNPPAKNNDEELGGYNYYYSATEIGMLSLSPETTLMLIRDETEGHYNLRIQPNTHCESFGIMNWQDKVVAKLYKAWDEKDFDVLTL